MAASFKKTVVKSYPRIGEKITRDTLYWKNFEFPVTKKEYGPISHIEFSPVAPYQYAVTNSTRVQIYNCRGNQINRTISRFKETASCGSFRGDGNLLVAGGDEGLVRLFNINSRTVLRLFKGHTRPVRVSKFTSDNLHVMSGSDDQTLRLWDIPSEKELTIYSEHQDYIRCGVTSKASKDILLTGSYDHTVRLFDTRTPSSVLNIDHGHPVESVLMFPSGGVFLSAGGNTVKVWNALAGGKLMAQFSNHHKTVTSMCFASDYQRLLTGSLDRHVKIYDVGTYELVHTLDYPGSVLTVAVSPDDKVLAVGMAEGLLSIQHRNQEENHLKTKKPKKASYKYVIKGKTYVPSKDDHVVQHKRKQQLARYDKFFKTFEHSRALDAAMDIRVRTKTPEVTVSVLLELIRRRALRAALAGRDHKSLSCLLKFLQKNLSNPKFSSVLLDVSSTLTDVYSSQLGECTEVDALFRELQRTVNMEVSYMKQLLDVMGAMDTLFAAAAQPTADQHHFDHILPSPQSTKDAV